MSSNETHVENPAAGELSQLAEPWNSSAVFRELLDLSRRGDGTPAGAAAQAVRRGALRYVLSALHARDAVTLRHSVRVATLASGFAQYLGWDDRQRKVLELAAFVHDLGKIGVPNDILYKPTSLGPAEMMMMDQHRDIGLDLLQACRADLKVLDLLSQYHEMMPGAVRRSVVGAVHQGARILSIADAYDAMTVDQVYRPKMSHSEAASELARCAGSQFDANLVESFVRWSVRDGGRLLDALGENTGEPAWPALRTAALDLAALHAHLYLFENLYDGFLLVDGDLQTVLFSSGARRMLGLSVGDVVSRPWSPRLLGYCDSQGKLLPEAEYPLTRVFATSRPAVGLICAQRAGCEVQIETYTLPVFDSEGDICGAVELFRDLSDVGLVAGGKAGTAGTGSEGGRARGERFEFRALHAPATLDSLTSIANRRSMETQLAWHVRHAQAQTPPEPFSVVFIDLDHFKEINDRFGHQVGDEVLVECATLLRGETYSGELVARYGGEEFVVLCPDTPLGEAVHRAERLRIALGQLAPAYLAGQPVSASLGVAALEAEDTAESLVHRADEALYLAKRHGRNQTVSLTLDEYRRLHGQMNPPPPTAALRPGEVRQWFYVCLPRTVLVHKLGGFASDFRGMIRETSDDGVRFRLLPRRRGLFGLRGRDVPVEVEFRIAVEGDAPSRSVAPAHSQSLRGGGAAAGGGVDATRQRQHDSDIPSGRGRTAAAEAAPPPRADRSCAPANSQSVRGGGAAARLLRVDVSICPVGLSWNQEAFARRAAYVLDELRRYLGIVREPEESRAE